MRMLLVATALAACGSPPTPAPRPPPPPPAAPVALAVVDAGPPPASAPEPIKGPFAALPPSLATELPRGPGAPVKRSGSTWPFHTWDRAESLILNWSAYGPQSSQRAYDAKGWSAHVAYRAPLDAALAKRSLDLVQEARGELLVSKCAVPRHAVILYEGDTPVASINVCFTCHDILLWPESPAPTKDPEKVADLLLPRWQTLFVDELRFPLWKE